MLMALVHECLKMKLIHHARHIVVLLKRFVGHAKPLHHLLRSGILRIGHRNQIFNANLFYRKLNYRLRGFKCSLKALSDAVLGLPLATEFEAGVRRTKQTLSAREFGLLRMLGQTSNLTDIGYKLHLSCKTISHHRQSIIRKLNCANNKELFSRLSRMGYHSKPV